MTKIKSIVLYLVLFTFAIPSLFAQETMKSLKDIEKSDQNNYYNPDYLANDSLQLEQSAIRKGTVLFSADFGGGYRTAKSDPSINDNEINRMRRGTKLSISLTGFLDQSNGIRFHFQQFNSRTANINLNGALLSSNYKFKSFGASYVYSYQIPNSKSFFMVEGGLQLTNVSIYTGLFANGFFGSGIGKAKLLSAVAAMNLQIYVFKGFYLKPNIGFVTGSFKTVKSNGRDLELEEPESITRIDYSMGVTIKF